MNLQFFSLSAIHSTLRQALRRAGVSALLVALGMFVLPSDKLLAATASTNFNVTANVVPGCLVVAVSIPFGTYTGATANALTTLAVTCTTLTSYNVGLNAGLGSGSTVSSRQMTAGAASLGYSLYSDAARTVNWGQTIGTDTVAGIGIGAAQVIFVYGQIPPNQYPAPGAYSDTITVALTY